MATRSDRTVGRYVHEHRVRYAECDMQGVVFNATYLTYVDDALDMWLQNALGSDYLARFDYVVKRAALEWAAPARHRDTIRLRPSVTRWGTTSMDITVVVDVADRLIVTGTVTLVSVTPGAHTPTAVPGFVREELDGTSVRE